MQVGWKFFGSVDFKIICMLDFGFSQVLSLECLLHVTVHNMYLLQFEMESVTVLDFTIILVVKL